MEQNTYRYLQELSKSDFQIVDEEPNIIGWEVKSETGVYIGEVKELLFDPQTRAVRYLIIDLDDNGMNLRNKKVMIPLGIAHLHTTEDEVVLPALRMEQFNALPDYDNAGLSPEMEVNIRSIIGSPAALRIEDAITEFDQDTFYAHNHFEKGRFYQRGGSPQEDIMNREEEQETIHDLIEHSKQQETDPNIRNDRSQRYPGNEEQDNGKLDPNRPRFH